MFRPNGLSVEEQEAEAAAALARKKKSVASKFAGEGDGAERDAGVAARGVMSFADGDAATGGGKGGGKGGKGRKGGGGKEARESAQRRAMMEVYRRENRKIRKVSGWVLF